MRAKGGGRRGGFTLIELIAVVLIVGLLTALTATRLDFLVPKYRLRGAAREVGSILKQGKARAAASGRDVYFEVDLSKGRYWLLVAFPKDVETESGELEEIAARPLEYRPVFERDLPDGTSFVDVILGEKSRVDSGRARVRLSPFGVAQHVILNLKNQDGREFAVRLNGFTGLMSYYEERKEADELLEDTGS